MRLKLVHYWIFKVFIDFNTNISVVFTVKLG